MKQYRILVVDDSAFMRRSICQIFEGDPKFSVIGIARNGLDAIEKVQRLKPDLVTMDLEMPEMNGLRAIEQIMKICPVPIVMLSSRTSEGAKETLEGLELGAVDFFLKDHLIKRQADSNQMEEFLFRLRGILETKIPSAPPQVKLQENKRIKRDKCPTELIIIGCSTGGPSALQKILPRFPKDFSIPIVVAQHMPPGFTKPLAERFDTLCQLKVQEIQQGQVLQGGTIYIAPSGYQTQFEKHQDGSVTFKVENEIEGKALYKPCIDITLNSAAPIFTDKLLSVILTGMGVDGTEGCSLVKKHRGNVLVEAEESCVVYGMPRAVKEAGYADGQYSLSQLYQEIMCIVQ